MNGCVWKIYIVEFKKKKCNGPYAYRSLLGWCVTGPIYINSSSPHRNKCNYVAVERNGSRPVHFNIQNELKDQTIEEMMLAMFNQDFSENKDSLYDAEKMSQEDRRFLRLMEKEVKFVDGHYQLPLPLKDPDLKFPNNRQQVVQRAISLKRKLEKNPKMYEDYKDFMTTIVNKGYARKISDYTMNKDQIWYIPHHGVYHPKKPDKIRVVFDCSATYKGISINSQLLQGPDLTNQIIGVLTRFRKEYVPIVNDKGQIFCSFLIGKSRVSPLKPMTIPRLELTAATTSVKVARQLREEIDIPLSQEIFWTDSQVVLGYIKNQSKKFHMFVANRIQTINENSDVIQWKYVASKDNPADYASRGQDVKNFVKNNHWFSGPKFLWQSVDNWPESFQHTVKDDDPEVKVLKKLKVNVVKTSESNLLNMLVERTSNWYRLKRIVATILRWKYRKSKIDVDLLCKAEKAIIKLVQVDTFRQELHSLQSLSSVRASPSKLNKTKCVNRVSCLYRLDPFIDEEGLLRVGGRLSKSNLPRNVKYPVVLPKNSIISVMIIRWCHVIAEHAGRGITLNELRQRGFFIINGNSRVRHVISKCVVCRRLRGKLSEQKMASLPTDRLNAAPPFTYSAVDMFGPFWIKEGRKEIKRYGALFTCMASRAVHLECTHTLDTDSFIMALRRFISRRGEVRQLRSDNGTNFTGAEIELRKAIQEMDQSKIAEFLLSKGTDWLKWKFNTPAASYMGGVWERQIRSARSILASLLNTHGSSLNDESFRTLLTEVEAVINSRPLTVDNLSDSQSLVPLTPNHLLTMKSKIIMAPPGDFEKADLYSRRRWRRIQHINNEFWSRWKHEYLLSLQTRQKWQSPKRNFRVGDVILQKEHTTFRNDWPMGRIIKTQSDDKGDVRSVTLRTVTNQVFDRPIHKLVLLVEAEDEETIKMKRKITNE